MNEDGLPQANAENATSAGGVVPGSSASNTRDADMDQHLGASSASNLPPIDDMRRQQQLDKIALKAEKEAQECAEFKQMTLDEKKKALDAYNNADYYTKGSYVDAQDTTNQFIMAKIVNIKGTDVRVNYDGWSDKWDYVSKHQQRGYDRNLNLYCLC